MPGATAIRTQGPDTQAAFAAEKAGNYTEAMRVWRKIDAEPEVDVAYPGGKGNVQLGGFTSAGLYVDGLAEARYKIAYYYEFGLGLNRNYTEAAAWYQKAVSTTDLNGNGTLFGTWATKRLGFLYAYGLGVSQDRAKARQLWAGLPEGVDNGKAYVRLLDNNALPQNMDDPNRFAHEVKDALARLDAEDARKQAVANQQREKEAADAERLAATGGPGIQKLACTERGTNNTEKIAYSLSRKLVIQHLGWTGNRGVNLPLSVTDSELSWTDSLGFLNVIDRETGKMARANVPFDCELAKKRF
jgi:hypothetical protein